MSDEKLEEVQRETEVDEDLQALRDIILIGWPGTKSQVPLALHEYWNFRDELTYVNGIVLKGTRVVVPKSMRKEMLNRIYSGHLGIEKCKSRARDVLYWPRMNSEIHDLVSKCSICLENHSSQQKEPMIPHEIPRTPWEIVGTDLFSFKGREYLVIVDYYSRYPEIALLKNSTSKEVIMHCKSIFSRHGIPLCVKSDNGPCYASAEFNEFAKSYGFSHVTTCPRYPQSNGQAERAVQTIKNILQKADDPYLGLLEYRNTPLSDTMASPAQMLMSRRLRSLIPTTSAQLSPKVITGMPEKLLNKQVMQKHYYDRNSRSLSYLQKGEVVRVQLQPQGKWVPGIIHELDDNPRSYIVETPDGGMYRRNRKFILQSNESPSAWQTAKVEQNMKINEEANPPSASCESQTQFKVIQDEVQAPEAKSLSASPSPPKVKQSPNKSPEPSQQPETITTRYGRVIKKPVRFTD